MYRGYAALVPRQQFKIWHKKKVTKKKRKKKTKKKVTNETKKAHHTRDNINSSKLDLDSHIIDDSNSNSNWVSTMSMEIISRKNGRNRKKTIQKNKLYSSSRYSRRRNLSRY